MRAIVKGDEITYELNTLEYALLHSAAMKVKHGAKVTKNDLCKVVKKAIENYCREVAATLKTDKSRAGKKRKECKA